jgi:hypothetical protein
LAAGALALLALPALAQPLPPASPEAIAEREALINKIASGQDYDASVARYTTLYQARQAQKEAVRAAAQQKRDEQQRQYEDVRARVQTLDFFVAQHCQLSVDPAASGGTVGMRADFGRVVQKQDVPRRTASGDEVTSYYLVQGSARTYALSSRSPTQPHGKGLAAAVGDLVLLCYYATANMGDGSDYPPAFRTNVVTSGAVAHLAAPPRIVDKRRWNPRHLVGESTLAQASRLRPGIALTNLLGKDGRPILSYIHVVADLGGGRFEIAAERLSYVLIVPPTLTNRELVQPGKYLWAIMSSPGYDEQLGKLTLRAEDLEAYYLRE